MVDEPIEFDSESMGLNATGVRNVPVCPLCTEELENTPKEYTYAQHNPDTRWFWCSSCQSHLGYHRMKAKWSIDPYDLDKSNTLREHFGLEPIDQE